MIFAFSVAGEHVRLLRVCVYEYVLYFVDGRVHTVRSHVKDFNHELVSSDRRICSSGVEYEEDKVIINHSASC